MAQNITAGPTNVEWLKTVFGIEWAEASVASFTGDPNKVGPVKWDAFAAGSLRNDLDLPCNNYFSLSLFDDPQFRQNKYFRGLYVVGIDDVGVKVDRTVLYLALGEPTLVIETSPGSEHWFYVLRAPVMDLDTARRLQRMFHSDARDVTRYLRLPVGVNGKFSPPFAVRVVRYNPGKVFDAADILLVEGRSFAVAAVDVGSDPFSGLVDGPGVSGASGRAANVNVSVGASRRVLEGYIAAGSIPVGEQDNGLMMFWGHAVKAWRTGKCSEEEALKFMGRVNVRLTGGADKDFAGKWERTCLAERAVGVLDAEVYRLDDDGEKIELFDWPAPLSAAEDFAGSPVEDEPPLADELLGDLVFVIRDEKWLQISTGELMSEPALNAVYNARAWAAGITGWTGKGAFARQVDVGRWLRDHGMKTVVARRVSRVGEPRFRDTPTGREVNVAQPWPAVPVGGVSVDIRPWLRMLLNVSGRDRVVAGLLADWLAFLVANIDEKPGWHVMLRGVPGIGKDEVLVPIERWLGRHARGVSLSEIEGSFNGYAVARLIRLDEAITTSRGGQIVYSEIKRYTSTNNSAIVVNEKNIKLTEAKDLSGWWITSNDKVPLPLTEDDRRFLVAEGVGARDVSLVRVARWAHWFAVARTDAGVSGVVGWLGRRWASMSDERRAVVRAGTAPMTAAKIEVARRAEHFVVAAVRAAIDPASGLGWGPALSVGEMVADLGLKGKHGLSRSQEQAVTARSVVEALQGLGCLPLKGGRSIGQTGQGKRRLWCLRPGMFEALETMGDKALLALANPPSPVFGGSGGEGFERVPDE